MSEHFVPVVGYEGQYEVNENGDVRRTDGFRLRRTQRSDGRYIVSLKQKACLLHRVVWEAFNGKLGKGEQVYFVDGDNSNCSVSNLTTERTMTAPKDTTTMSRGDLLSVKTEAMGIVNQLDMILDEHLRLETAKGGPVDIEVRAQLNKKLAQLKRTNQMLKAFFNE
jgi:hypothetical protein